MAPTHTQQVTWQQACVYALASLPRMSPARLAALLADTGPEAAWQLLGEGRQLPDAVVRSLGAERSVVCGAWRRSVRETDPLAVLDRYRAHGIEVWSRFSTYPARLTPDQWAPTVAFWRGDEGALRSPTVAIVGTRRCSAEGRETAARFGRELAEAGVAVVSGLALGIDGAAHRGALGAQGGGKAIGVVGSGLDVVYPKRHHDLWDQVASSGLLISEAPLGAKPEPWRFPARNRIIAGLADLVVVVESHAAGGSLLTVEEAATRGVTVMAVPGSVRNPAAAGSNRLLSDGCAPACSVDDVLDELDGAAARRPVPGAGLTSRPDDHPDEDGDVFDAVDWQPTSMDTIAHRTGWEVAHLAAALVRLEEGGWIVAEGGWWRRKDRS